MNYTLTITLTYAYNEKNKSKTPINYDSIKAKNTDINNIQQVFVPTTFAKIRHEASFYRNTYIDITK